MSVRLFVHRSEHEQTSAQSITSGPLSVVSFTVILFLQDTAFRFR